MKKIDILILVWPGSMRDLHILLPVIKELRTRFNLVAKYGEVFNGLLLSRLYRPRLILFANTIGAVGHFEMAKYLYRKGYKIASLISEGNVSDDSPSPYLWGYNHDRVPYFDFICLWSNRSKLLLDSLYPKLKDKSYVTGHTGVDRYKNFKYSNKEKILQKLNKSDFEKVIGFAGWGFDLFSDREYFRGYVERDMLGSVTMEQVEMHRRDRDILRNILKRLITENTDILFILRFHPGVVYPEETEFYGIEDFPNVYLSSDLHGCEIGISDIINGCDLWLAYESITALEAWMLNKPTFLINPTAVDFVRERVHIGSPKVKTCEEAQALINEFYETGKIAEFEKLKEQRVKSCEEVVGWVDGKNSERTARIIEQKLNEPLSRTIEIGIKPSWRIVKYQIKYVLAKYFGFFKNNSPQLVFDKRFKKVKELYFDTE